MFRIKTVFSVLALVSLAGCSSQPVMQPSHVAALRSGRMIVAVPKRAYVTLSSPYAVSGSALAEGLGVTMGGAVGAAIYSAAAPGQDRKVLVGVVLRPYASQIRQMHSGQHFFDIARLAADQTPWMGNDPEVSRYTKPDAPGSGAMSRIVQSGGTQAVVLLNCAIGFSFDLKTLYAEVQVGVYAQGPHHANLIDGGTLKAGTDLQDAGSALGDYGVEGIASGKPEDLAALGARANLWLENDGKRYRTAVAEDMAKLRPMLINYLNGRRSSG